VYNCTLEIHYVVICLLGMHLGTMSWDWYYLQPHSYSIW